jgi:hypothetical protein
MTTVKNVLALAERLEALVARKTELDSIISATTDKGSRLTGEVNSINGQITSVKNQLKAAAAAME